MKKLSKSFFVLALIAVLFFSVGRALAANPVSTLVTQCGNATTVKGDCASVSIFVSLLIAVGQYIFGIVGALALLFFIYGGFTWILSQGNPEKVKKGRDIVFAAVIGLIIVFGAYILVQFIGTTLGVSTNLK